MDLNLTICLIRTMAELNRLVGTPLRKTSKDKKTSERLNCEKCIICQVDNPSTPLRSTENGRKRILDAAEIREDIVEKRLKLLKGEEFVYHMNNPCYKTYTLKKNIR